MSFGGKLFGNCIGLIRIGIFFCEKVLIFMVFCVELSSGNRFNVNRIKCINGS